MTKLLFDIEAGGFSPRSSIQQIAFAIDKNERTETALYAAPEQGTFLSRWAQSKILKETRRAAQIQTEQQILSQFLHTLESLPSGTTVAGWNIGYNPASKEAGAMGYDIPMLISRGEKYGLGSRFQKEFSRFKIRDIGQEYAIKMAQEVSRREDLVQRGLLNKELFEGAVGYTKQAANLRRQFPGQSIPKILGMSGTKVSGWKQELMYEAVFDKKYKAHSALEDVRAARKLFEQSGSVFANEASMIRWGRSALHNKLISSALSGARSGVDPSQHIAEILQTAVNQEAIGGEYYTDFYKEFTAGLVEETKLRGGSLSRVYKGLGVKEAGTIVGQSRLNWKVGLGVGAGIGIGLLAAKHSSLFSGKDDNYNTIQGLPDGGQAAKMRHILTDFGSGYQGISEEKSLDSNRNLAGFALIGGGALWTGKHSARWGKIYAEKFIKPWSEEELANYPRLQELRKTGQKYGLKVLSPDVAEMTKVMPWAYRQLYKSFLKVTPSWKGIKGFKGLVYPWSVEDIYKLVDLPLDVLDKHINQKNIMFGSPNIHQWMDKFSIYKSIEEGMPKLGIPGLPGIQPEAYMLQDLVKENLVNEWVDLMGGRQNIVLKPISGAMGKRVYIGGQNLNRSIFKKIITHEKKLLAGKKSPHEELLGGGRFMIQKKADLVQEFRAVTVGGKSIYTAHRFGSDKLKEISQFLEKETPTLHNIIKSRHSLENVEPIRDLELRKRVELFAEKIGQHANPDILAYDIGLTRSGELTLIEAQQSFGTIRNPVVASRISEILTGKQLGRAKRFGYLLGGATGIAAIGTLGLTGLFLFSGKDDAYNTIEGLPEKGMASKRRKQNTDFGSGWKGLFSRIAGKIRNIFQSGSRSSPGLSITIPSNLSHVFGMTNPGFSVPIYHANRVISNARYELWAMKDTLSPFQRKMTTWRLNRFEKKFNKLINANEDADAIAVINKYQAKLWGKEVGLSANKAINAIREHELFHNFAVESGARYSLHEFNNLVPKEFMTHISKQSAYADMGNTSVFEEYVAHALTYRKAKAFPTGLTKNTFNVNKISGFDDVYNVIEGLGHSGYASHLRKMLTDFGSGFMSSISRGIRNFMTMSSRDVRTAVKRSIGTQIGEGTLALRYGVKGKTETTGSLIIKNNRLQEKAIITISKQDKGMGFFMLGHEGSEAFYIKRGLSKSLGKAEQELDPLLQNLSVSERLDTLKMAAENRAKELADKFRFGSHYNPAVVVDELLLSAKMGPEFYTKAKNFRLAELESLRKYGHVKAVEKYITRTEKVIKTFEKKWLPKFDHLQKTRRKATQQVLHKQAMVRSSVNGFKPGQRHRSQAGKVVV